MRAARDEVDFLVEDTYGVGDVGAKSGTTYANISWCLLMVAYRRRGVGRRGKRREDEETNRLRDMKLHVLKAKGMRFPKKGTE
jgi:hypothetical protein